MKVFNLNLNILYIENKFWEIIYYLCGNIILKFKGKVKVYKWKVVLKFDLL